MFRIPREGVALLRKQMPLKHQKHCVFYIEYQSYSISTMIQIWNSSSFCAWSL